MTRLVTSAVVSVSLPISVRRTSSMGISMRVSSPPMGSTSTVTWTSLMTISWIMKFLPRSPSSSARLRSSPAVSPDSNLLRFSVITV